MEGKQKQQSHRLLIDERIAQFIETVSQLDAQARNTLEAAGRMLVDCFKSGGRVYVCGNGGSAADAQHIAGELAGRFLRNRRALPCLALTVDTSILTAVGNDFGFDHVFSRQVEAYVCRGDVLWILSTSGNSKNVLEAAEQASSAEAQVLAFTGKDGGKLASLCDVCFRAPATRPYGIQQIHQLAYHILCELAENACCESGR